MVESVSETVMEKVNGFVRRCKWTVQRQRHGWDERAGWSVDYAHSRWMVGVLDEHLRQIREHEWVGPPARLLSNSASFDHSDEDLDKAKDEWEWIIETIRDGFQAHLDYEDRVWWNFEEEFEQGEYNRRFKEEGDRMLEKRKLAFELLSEYYDDLWW